MMDDIKQLLRYCLLASPELYQNPCRVLEHIFCVSGNGYAWKRGRVVYNYPSERTGFDGKMRYDDLEVDPQKRLRELTGRQADDPESLAALPFDPPPDLALRRQAKRVQRAFVEENIEAILAAPLTNTYFGPPYAMSPEMLRQPSPRQQMGLGFPDNIQADWAKVLWDFLGHWEMCLTQRYGVGRDFSDDTHWPIEASQLRKHIRSAKERLRPKVVADLDAEGFARKLAEVNSKLASARPSPAP